MSASNWATCPRCAHELDHAVVEAQKHLDDARAANDLRAFETAMFARDAALKARQNLKDTFREDYEIYGADEGTVTVVYGGECQTCHLALSFRHEHPLDHAQAEGR